MILDARQETDTPTDTSAGNHEARDRHTQTDIRARKQADSIAYAHAVSHMNDWKLQSTPFLYDQYYQCSSVHLSVSAQYARLTCSVGLD